MLSSVYNFNSSSDFLSAVLAEKKAKNTGYSMRAWSKQLGFRNPSTLSGVLQGHRRLSPELAHRLASSLCETDSERRYFEVLAMMEKAKSSVERDVYAGVLASLRPQSVKVDQIAVERFRFVADWYHVAVLEMVSLKDFVEDAKTIAEQLGPEISPATIQDAINRLVTLEWLERDSHGKLTRKTPRYIVDDSVPSDAVKNHHEQMIDRAKLALHTQSREERDFRGTTFAVKRESIPELVRLIHKFHHDIHQYTVQSGADEVYRVNTQCFKVTQNSPTRTKGKKS